MTKEWMMDNQWLRTWVASNGGPLLLLDRQLADAWEGVPLAEANRAVPTDYERACAINDYLGTIAVGDGWGVILNDEPLATAWRAHPEGRGGLLVRWSYAPNATTVERALRDLDGVAWESAAVTLTAPSGRCILFDAAWSGREVREQFTIASGPHAGEPVAAYLDQPIEGMGRRQGSGSAVVATCARGSAGASPHSDAAIIDLSQRVYRLETAHYRPTAEMYLLLHRLVAE